MNISTKLLKAAAGQAGGAGLDVDEVFSTHVYDGTNAHDHVINNGIDLSGEGGLVWIKSRDVARNHAWYDTERGVNKYISSNTGDGNTDLSSSSDQGLKSFNSNGFTVDDNELVNANDPGLVSWTFRKASKFFDIVTYTGNATARTISHNLGSVPGMIIIKRLDSNDDWYIYHRGNTSNPETEYLRFTDNATADSAAVWNDTQPTSTEFTINQYSLNNANGESFIAYLFAHHANDGSETGFGPDGDSPVISCGSISGYNGRAELGFEPQWLLLKSSNYDSTHWIILDVMRGWTPAGSNDDAHLWANLTNAEANYDGPSFDATGFNFGQTGDEYVYMAIRRGPLATPTSASDVFAISTNGQAGDYKAPAYRSTFPVDMYFEKSTGGSPGYISSRLTGSKYLTTNATSAEATDSNLKYDFMNGVYNSTGSNSAYYGYMWKRAPSYFDVIAWTGDGVVDRTVSHNLGAVPEMWWIKQRDGTGHWAVQHKVFPSINKLLYLNLNGSYSQDYTNFIAPTSTSICIGGHGKLGGTSNSNGSGADYIGYLFATVAGVSKVGSFTGATSDVTVDCGFSNGAKFVIIKDASATDDWYVYDTARGIVAGNDGYLELNTTNAENTGADYIDPHSSGFIITSGFMQSGRTYIFYAIAT